MEELQRSARNYIRIRTGVWHSPAEAGKWCNVTKDSGVTVHINPADREKIGGFRLDGWYP